MIDTIDHIGIAVKSLDQAVPLYRDVLGFRLEGIHTLTDRKLKVAFFTGGEHSRIELLESLGSESSVAKFLETHGEGIHHLAMKVEDVKAALDTFKLRGVRLINETPISGAEGTRIAFVHPKSTCGVLLELVQRP